jgi:uncharacterized protein
MEKSKFDLSNRLYIPLLVIGLALVTLLAMSAYAAYNSATGYYPREITVSGNGKAYIKPDIAIINLGVTTEGKKSEDAVKENNDKMNTIIKELKAMGLSDADIRTTNYSLSPKHNWIEGKGDFIDGYTLSQQLELKIRDFDKVGDILQKATSLGANTIDQVQFTIEDPQKVKAEAMREAVTKAKEKANDIADASGLKLGKLVSVYEDTYSGISNPSPMYSVAEAKGAGGGSDASTSVPDIQPGQQEVNVTMNLTYRLN